ncbi:serum paraoxonase/arylesterase [Dacryopinax primogenitus]|uniref:Serum paraoxonase/arylesterase n=1 Tax=Dacryopinax primogenitus (strain DJM 731) TaxID=1858805 RepID=M5G113_DACPD|nr:serum paraoxonase/arylesterase [Dacryopinax primogenitus]EJU01840.1 serum paraoxonase/arylesterase [Dacryopinax primogenitus]
MPPKAKLSTPLQPIQRDPSIAGVATVGVLLFALGGAAWFTWLSPLMSRFGMVPWRYAESFNNGRCEEIEGLDSCEKVIWHSPSNTLYLACSSLESRLGWTPFMDHLDSSKRSATDSFFTYQPSTGTVTKLEIEGYPYPGMGISMHGFSLVPAEGEEGWLWVYAVNHRIPREGGAREKGADSVIEVLKLKVGEERLQWVRTIEDGGRVIKTPNDVLGGPTGEWVYFSNEYGEKLGLSRSAMRLGLPYGFGYVGFCHVTSGCSVASPPLSGPNGLARGRDGKVWVSVSYAGDVVAFEEVRTGELKEVDRIPLNRYEDNLSVDENGDIFVATIPRVTDWKHHFEAGGKGLSPSGVHRIHVNQSALHDPEAKSKYAAELFFADDGRRANGVTTVEYWMKGRKLFLHGHIARYLTVCTL